MAASVALTQGDIVNLRRETDYKWWIVIYRKEDDMCRVLHITSENETITRDVHCNDLYAIRRCHDIKDVIERDVGNINQGDVVSDSGNHIVVLSGTRAILVRKNETGLPSFTLIKNTSKHLKEIYPAFMIQ